MKLHPCACMEDEPYLSPSDKHVFHHLSRKVYFPVLDGTLVLVSAVP